MGMKGGNGNTNGDVSGEGCDKAAELVPEAPLTHIRLPQVTGFGMVFTLLIVSLFSISQYSNSAQSHVIREK